MKIAVCIKQVPDTMEISIDKQTGILIRDKAPAILNPFDAYAIEEGLQITEKLGGDVVALTMGPPAATDVLYEVMGMGVLQGVHICDDAFRGSDSFVTAQILASAIKKLGDVDLILCGKQAIDGDTAQVGPEIAEILGIPHVSYVKKIRQVEQTHLIVERMVETGIEVVEVRLPALLTVLKDINTPRMPSFRMKRQAKQKQIPTWGIEELGFTKEQVGLNGSPTTVMRTFTAAPRGDCEILSGSSEQVISALFEKLDAKEL